LNYGLADTFVLMRRLAVLNSASGSYLSAARLFRADALIFFDETLAQARPAATVRVLLALDYRDT
jgi:hypothetical protein